MNITSKLKDIKEKMLKLENIKNSLKNDYDHLLDEFETNDFASKYEKIEKQYKDLKEKNKDLSKENLKVKESNLNLKIALKEQIASEKLAIIKNSKKKINRYFEKQEQSNSLSNLENKALAEIERIENIANKSLKEESKDFQYSLNELHKDLHLKINAIESKKIEQNRRLAQDLDIKYRKLQDENIDNETIKKIQKQNKLEVKLGLNVINKIGIILVLFGVIAAFKHSYSSWFNDYMKGIVFFLLGGGFLGVGEFFFRKNKKVFSLGMLGAGFAILYSSVFFSYFLLKIMDMNMAIISALFITATTIILSLRYNSKTICIFGLLGGYLPILAYGISFGFQETELKYLIIYILMLNMITLSISIFKKWILVNYISFFTHLPAMLFVIYSLENKYLAIAYGFFSYVLYMILSLLYPIKYKVKLKLPDQLLTGLNTFICFIIQYFLFEDLGLGDYKAVLALAFGIVYYLLGVFIDKYLDENKNTLLLYFGTALSFSVIIIPIQFGIEWLSMGWLLESLLIMFLGFRMKNKKLYYSGLSIFIVCLLIFYIYDYHYQLSFNYIFKYTSIVAGQGYLFYLLFKNQNFINNFDFKFMKFFKYFIIISTIVYELVLINYLFSLFEFNYAIYVIRVLCHSIALIATAYLLSKLKDTADKFTEFLSIALYIIALILTYYLNVSTDILANYSLGLATKIVVLSILVLYNIVLLVSLREVLKRAIVSLKMNFEFYPVLFSLILLTNSISIIIAQFSMELESVILGIIILIFALINIIIGFKKSYRSIRILGLALSFIIVAKTFFIDFSFFKSEMKILAYFGFGISLIFISYVYQKMKTILEAEIDEESN